jgi:hypothetical protein
LFFQIQSVSNLFQPTIISFEYYNILRNKRGGKKMKTLKILTITGIALVAALLLVSTVAAMGPLGSNLFGGMMGGYGYGYNGSPYTNQPSTTAPSTQYNQPVYPSMFGGMMSRMGSGFYGMMRNYGYAAPYANTGTPLTIVEAKTIAQNYVTSTGNPDLTVKQVEEYKNNFYVQVNEASTGKGAFELLINKQTGSIYPEMGPNMMWNTKYGMMRSGILGGIYGTPATTLPVTEAQATTDAQTYLNTYVIGATTGDVTAFYGYYTIEILNGGTTYGMLSVNGYTGQVWFHTWHGTFIAELQVS